MPQIHVKSDIVLFDGVCNLCDGIVQWIIRHDPHAKFRFAALQSEEAQSILRAIHVDASSLNSIILIEGDLHFTKSTAVLRISRRLSGVYPLLYVGILIPVWIRHRLYDWVAVRRYRWFAQKSSCMIPTPAMQARFLSGQPSTDK